MRFESGQFSERLASNGIDSGLGDGENVWQGWTSRGPLRQSPLQMVSIVIPCFNEQAAFRFLFDRLTSLSDGLEREMNCHVELILVDDGSRDSTWQEIQGAVAADCRFRGVRLSRNFGHQAALTCGYSFAAGDAIICLDADLQDPPEVIPEMIRQWRAGADVVYGVRLERDGETWFKLWTARQFYKLIRALGAEHVRADTGDFRLLSRRSLRVLLGMGEQHRFLRGMVGWVGFTSAEVTYHRKARVAGTTKYPLRKMVRLAADAIVSFSRAPLRIAYHAALWLSFLFLLFLLYALVAALVFKEALVPGWSSLILAIVTFGASNLCCQAILGEYVGRIYEECKKRPLYIVQELAAQARLNNEQSSSLSETDQSTEQSCERCVAVEEEHQ